MTGKKIRIGVLALQGDVREHVRALAVAGAEPAEVRGPEELAAVDGLVLPGGESTTIGRLLRIFGLLEPLRAAVGDGLPVYGSCAGMILLARDVLDGRPDQPLIGGLDMVVRRNAFGRQVDSFEADLDVVGVDGPPMHAVFIRAPWVEKSGDGVAVLARVGEHPVAVRQGHLLATSFHPELTGDTRMHELFVEMVRQRGRA
ncbi:pyridoxal 5'-phosphate synthase glutaminase subunit PdxT [Frankia sp. CNm7]|uniref:Pyridoxal 5'-phosphate synthase subunit PdxT n=1 Tax=Frankia nepalensis TaxID=1836974 RepID=A0A937US68_9ACTN|nr:pyridoxal 5'-phosphate synthase glutaminase subunit PdxT [Frankia nepalensis]MBL7494756.1 pyridoxal 5'-phosphate synthase glutaminase subunit PdxT [Frankia nepalensis]MBL7514023.1 pyridoxal 5'-phosphate synthase glutaminase subunit PdxT [Frankia nepalensis]MBL7519715.1 pyridoxal 5'-phosphate synthase glutaminase subunit PdxT [Frankia nepalensis]MBL7629955.1 pyridoxal 5'-phosphate synthase glutaminase subunit PdxT [Frankia nepalensis]